MKTIKTIDHHPVLGKLRAEEITIFFEGEALKTRKGRTVAAALMENGISKFGVSRKMNQARGVFCAIGRCFSCFVTIDGEEHVRSCFVLAEDGMEIKRNMGDPDIRGVSNDN